MVDGRAAEEQLGGLGAAEVQVRGVFPGEAASLADEAAAEFGVAAATAHICCSQAYLFAAAENIQVHGGIG